MSGKPDPRPEKRKRATRSEWVDVREAVTQRDGAACLLCGGSQDLTIHHVVPRSQGGDDIPANSVWLCGSGTTGCHGAIEARRPKMTALLRHGLPADVAEYVISKKGWAWLERRYGALSEPEQGVERPQVSPAGMDSAAESPNASGSESPPCSRCKGTGRQPEHTHPVAKPSSPTSKTWKGVTAPVDEIETLDELFDAVVVYLGLGTEKKDGGLKLAPFAAKQVFEIGCAAILQDPNLRNIGKAA
jgi:hypothetical protein